MKGQKGFQPGRKKTGGRKKGTVNKRTADITERLEGEDIVGSLLNIAKTTDDEVLRASIYKDLMQYVYPKRKAVEMAADMNINTKSIQIELI